MSDAGIGGKRKRGLDLSGVSASPIAGVLLAALGFGIGELNDRLSLPTSKANAAAAYGAVLERTAEPYGERADRFQIAIQKAADAPLSGQPVGTARLQFRDGAAAWSDFQRIFVDVKYATDAAHASGVLSDIQHQMLTERLRLAINASQRTYTCVYDAVTTYGPGAPGVINARSQPELALRCPVHRAGTPVSTARTSFVLSQELEQIDSCTSGLRTAMLELNLAMRTEGRETPLDYVLRRIGLARGDRPGSLNQRWPRVRDVLKARCQGDLASRRTPLTGQGNIYPWQGAISTGGLLQPEAATGLTPAAEAALGATAPQAVQPTPRPTP